MTETSNEEQVDLFPVKKPGTDDVIMVTAEVKDLMNEQISLARKDARMKAEKQFQPVKDMLAEYEAKNGTISEELETIKEAQMSESEKIQNQYKKELKKYQDSVEAASKDVEYWQNQYKANKIQNDIYSAFGDYKLTNNEHARLLFENDVETDIQPVIDSDGNATGQYVTKMKMIVSDGNGGFKEMEGSPKELFKHWIEQDKNKHLLLNNLAPGAGSSQNGKLDNLSGIDKLRAMHAEAIKAGDGVKAMHLKSQIAEAAKEK